MMIDELIKKLLAYFPTVWPLQQAISVNPLADLTSASLSEACAKLNTVTNVKPTLSSEEYLTLLTDNKIEQSSMMHAIDYFFTKKSSINPDNKVTINLISQVIFQYITQYLTDNKPSVLTRSENKASQLLALRLNDYFVDNVHAIILEESLNIIMDYTHNHYNISLLSHWSNLVKYKSITWNRFIKDININDENLIEQLLAKLNIDQSNWQSYLFTILWQLKGWVGFVKWQQANEDNPWHLTTLSLKDMISIWLIQEVFWINCKKPIKPLPDEFNLHFDKPAPTNELWHDFFASNIKKSSTINTDYLMSIAHHLPLTTVDITWILQHAYEVQYQSNLTKQLTLSDCENALPEHQPSAQWVFCIDVRSEACRRLLEKAGNYQTFGFAGFFNFSFSLIEDKSNTQSLQCPVLIKPTLMLNVLTKLSSFEQLMHSSSATIANNKQALTSPFMMVEMLGLYYAIVLFAKNLASRIPYLNTRHPTRCKTVKQFKLKDINSIIDLNFDTLYQQAKILLTVLGIQQTANIVVLCGHGATTTNNPFHSSLNCGACGGNSGISNASFACSVFNHEKIRAQLNRDGFKIKDSTQFIPALHDTTKNTITLLNQPSSIINESSVLIENINRDLRQVEAQLQQEKIKQLPGNPNLNLRSMDWSEVLPETGLANNAAMIIAPRSLTQTVDLNARVFLHEYHQHADKDGAILETIMTAPMMVAHWINMQYYFSSVDPGNYGSGNKVLHNVLPNVGVIEGNLSDLKIGLPQQSLFFKDRRLHQPMRLFVLIHCALETLMAIIEKHDSLKTLIKGDWLWLSIISKEYDIISINQILK